MGQTLCCMKPPKTQDEPKRVNPCDSNCSTPTKIRQDQNYLTSPTTTKHGATRPCTLEQCLMDSPEVDISQCSNNFGCDNQLKVVQKYQKLELSSPDFYTPRLSFSSDKLGLLQKIGEEEDEGSSGSSIDGKVKKRVSFKLPEEADIIIFYSPKVKFDHE